MNSLVRTLWTIIDPFQGAGGPGRWARASGGPEAVDESDFWNHLEYRVCREIEGLRRPELRRFWCDGFIPSRYDLGGPSPRIVGRVWMGSGPREQQEWEFDLLLRGPVASREAIEWSTLLPLPEVTRWLTLDPIGKRLVVEPAVAVPDAL
jgi:hypothetical protein